MKYSKRSKVRNHRRRNSKNQKESESRKNWEWNNLDSRKYKRIPKTLIIIKWGLVSRDSLDKIGIPIILSLSTSKASFKMGKAYTTFQLNKSWQSKEFQSNTPRKYMKISKIWRVTVISLVFQEKNVKINDLIQKNINKIYSISFSDLFKNKSFSLKDHG